MDEKTIHIPGWRIIRVIGKGSSGTVYEIEKEDEFGGGIRSALKVISIPESRAEIEAYRDDGYDDESLTKLFRSRVEDITSEFRLMNKLRGSSNIVGYEDHSVVQHENDPGYDVLIRMELLTPLPKYFDRRFGTDAIDERTVRKLGADICRALELCGRFNIIHRDIKPQNIFVSDLGDFKLGDFGIAKTSDHTTRATKTGTYNYMAPEVYRSEPYNATVDIYSLGIVLYWMLNDRRGPFLPLPPEIPTSGQTFEAMERRMHGEPLPAPKNGSEELVRIVLKACAYDPKDRYASPAEMRRDLERAAFQEVPFTITMPEMGEMTVDAAAPAEQSHRSAERAEAPLPRKTQGTLFGAEDKTVSTDPGEKTADATAAAFPKEPAHTDTQRASRETGEKEPTPSLFEQDKNEKPARKKTGKQKNRLLPILTAAVLLVAAAIVLLVVLGGKNRTAPQTAEEPTAEPVIQTTDTPEPTPAATPDNEIVDEIQTPIPGQIPPSSTEEPQSTDAIAEQGYETAYELFTAGRYEEAIAAFEALDGYRDSAEMIETCKAERDYAAALALYEAGEYRKAIPVFIRIREYRDSNTYLLACWDHVAERKTVAALWPQICAVKTDGTVAVTEYVGDKNWNKGQGNVSDWKDIIAICTGEYGYYTVGLKADGTVVATGDNEYGQCNVSEWTDIVEITAGYKNTFGLRADGTVVATGDNEYGQCDVSEWTDIIAIKTSGRHTVGLKADGTVVATGSNDDGRCNVSEWTNIIAIAAGGRHTVGLKADGTVVATGSNDDGQCNVSEWTDITEIVAEHWVTIGLKSDGTVAAVGSNTFGESHVNGWSDIAAIDSNGYTTYGLKSDGTVVAVGNNDDGDRDVYNWKDIADIYCHSLAIGLKSDRTLVLAGDTSQGRRDALKWTDIMLPNEGRRVPGPIHNTEPATEAEETAAQTEKSFSDYAPTINMSFEELVGSLSDFDETNPNSNESFRMPYGYPAADTYRVVVDLYWQTVMVYTKDKNGEYTVPVRYMLCSAGDKIKTGVYKMKTTRVRFGNYANGASAQYWSMIYDRTYFVSTLYSKYRDLSSVDKESYEALAAGKAFTGADGIRLSVPDARWIFYNICYDTEIEIRKGSQNDIETGEIRAKLHLAPWKDNADVSVANTPYTDNWRIEDVTLAAPYVHTTQSPDSEGASSTPAASTPKPSSSQNKTGKVIAGQVALRRQPDSSSECIKDYSNGEVVTILNTAKDSDGRKWYYVKTSDGKKGYIFAYYVKIISG